MEQSPVTEPPALIIKVRAPHELIDKHCTDVLNTSYTIDLDTMTFKSECTNDESEFSKHVDEDTQELVGVMLLWALKQRMLNASSVKTMPTQHVELF